MVRLTINSTDTNNQSVDESNSSTSSLDLSPNNNGIGTMMPVYHTNNNNNNNTHHSHPSPNLSRNSNSSGSNSSNSSTSSVTGSGCSVTSGNHYSPTQHSPGNNIHQPSSSPLLSVPQLHSQHLHHDNNHGLYFPYAGEFYPTEQGYYMPQELCPTHAPMCLHSEFGKNEKFFVLNKVEFFCFCRR